MLKDGAVELMQNRRDNLDDWRGVGEALNEKDSQGNGISVPATYYVQYFNTQKRTALQRQIQMIVDAPVQQFFSFDFGADKIQEAQIVGVSQDGYSQLLAQTGFTSEMKLELFTMGRNSILMRIENIGDIFNTEGVVSTTGIKIRELVEGLYNLVNGVGAEFTVEVTEMNLTANQSFKTMKANKIQWTTVDDQPTEKNVEVSEIEDAEFTQQAIKVFQVKYNQT